MSELRFDQSWSLPFPKHPAFVAFTPCRIRPDDRFERQLYLPSFSQVQPTKALGILAQAVESDDGKSVTIHKIFEKNIPTNIEQDNMKYIQFCVDEVASKLYLIFRGTKQDGRGEKPFHLSVSSLSFGEPDRFGHRRVTLSGDVGMYRINFGDKCIKGSNVFLHPKTGELLFYIIFGEKCLEATGKLDLHGAHGRTVDAQISSKFDSGLYSLINDSFRFTDKGKRLTVFNWSFRNFISEASSHQEPERSLMQTYSIENGECKLERKIYCNQQDLIASIYPIARRFESIAELLCNGIHFNGHIFKYTVLTCVRMGVALVKNFHGWIEADLCRTKTRHCFLSFKTPDLFREIGEVGNIVVQYVLGSTLYYTVLTPSQATGRRLELGDHFKDYRVCAYCGTKETNKRRNPQGKRIAKFKVCRDCKQLNLHHQWWKLPCHYCSDQCMRNGWKEHKKIHRK